MFVLFFYYLLLITAFSDCPDAISVNSTNTTIYFEERRRKTICLSINTPRTAIFVNYGNAYVTLSTNKGVDVNIDGEKKFGYYFSDDVGGTLKFVMNDNSHASISLIVFPEICNRKIITNHQFLNFNANDIIEIDPNDTICLFSGFPLSADYKINGLDESSNITVSSEEIPGGVTKVGNGVFKSNHPVFFMWKNEKFNLSSDSSANMKYYTYSKIFLELPQNESMVISGKLIECSKSVIYTAIGIVAGLIAVIIALLVLLAYRKKIAAKFCPQKYNQNTTEPEWEVVVDANGETIAQMTPYPVQEITSPYSLSYAATYDPFEPDTKKSRKSSQSDEKVHESL